MISILYTGGTIGMRQTPQGLLPDEAFSETLSAFLTAQGEEAVEVVEVLPLIDSASATPKTWRILIEAVRQALARSEAVIVLHGTDTLAYSAAALYFAQQNQWIDPKAKVFITGAMRAWHSQDSDAIGNVCDALSAARACEIAGVYAVFAGQILPAENISKIDCADKSAFISPHQGALAQCALSDLDFNAQIKAHRRQSMKGFEVNALSSVQFSEKERKVALIWLTPGMAESAYLPLLTDDEVGAVIIAAYGAGNAPNTHGLLKALGEAAKTKALVCVSQCLKGEISDEYASGLAHLGVMMATNTTLECAYVGLYYALNAPLYVDAWQA